MENIAERIRELKEAEGLSNTEFAKATDLNPAIISHVLSGRNKPSLQVISSIKESFTNVNLDYLVSGRGSLFIDLTNVNSQEEAPDSPAEQPGLQFPMEGVRAASVPGGPTRQREVEAEKTPPEAEENAEERTSSPADREHLPQEQLYQGKTSKKEVEQIVILYTDGSFKAYHP